MKLSVLNTVATSLLFSSTAVVAQTFSDCNPRQDSCPPKPAFGKSSKFDFTQGESDEFHQTGNPSYGSDGASFTVSQQGDAPLLNSKWYIMFGHVEFVIKAAPGKGIVSSAVLQSDDLDEIDWEWLGGNNALVQSNYFGKGNTDSFNRGATHNNPGNHDDFHTYTIDWTSSQIVWQIDGKTVRVLTPDTAEENQYPQTPMMIRVGVWAGGDPNNPQGTIDWAGGEVDYSAGPYTMYLKSLKVTDYSTGSTYSYGDKSGSWESIQAEGGKVNGNSGAESFSSVQSAPTVTATVDSIPIPFSGTHRETSSFVTPDIWPWVPTPTQSSTRPERTFPDGWTSSGSGPVQPPSAASSTCLSTSVSLPSSPASVSPSVSHSGHETESRDPTSTRSHTQTTDYSFTTTQGSASTTGTAPTTTSPSATAEVHAAPNVNTATHMVNVPVMIHALSWLLAGGLMLL